MVEAINRDVFDFICLNYANATWLDIRASKKPFTEAVETVDRCCSKPWRPQRARGYSIIITADHGNADYAINPDGFTQYGAYNQPVPCWLISDEYRHIKPGRLSDLAPTVLKMLQIPFQR